MIRLSPIIGHLLLVASITLDYYRRESAGVHRSILLLLGAVVLLIATVYFLRDPRAFFFGHPRQSSYAAAHRRSTVKMAGAWCFVVGWPILWLTLTPRLLDIADLSLTSRLIAAYLLFLWFAASMILSKFLFPHENR